CNSDSDCGTDGFIGENFCRQNNVYRNFRTFTCNNPGESDSSCSSNVEARLRDECNEQSVCTNGRCEPEQEVCYDTVIYRQEDFPELDDTASFFNRNGFRIHNQPQIEDRWIVLSRDILISSGTNHYLKKLDYFGRGNDKNSEHRFEAYIRNSNNQNIRHILIDDDLEDEQRHFIFDFSRNARKVFWPQGIRLGQYGDLTATFCRL
ncbi:MAG: hypothetical protein AABX77_03335, partial [Nanoarchaeota archaeon]